MHIFIPTDEQRESIANYYSNLGNIIQEKLPFVGWFSTTINNTQINGIGDTEILKISVPSFSYFGGNTQEKVYIDVFQAYEPYRENIRSKLSLIVYLGTVIFYVTSIIRLQRKNSSIGGEEK